MNRRQVLAALLAGGAAAAVGELIVPTRKIFLPPRAGWPINDPDRNGHDLFWETRQRGGHGGHMYYAACDFAVGVDAPVFWKRLPSSAAWAPISREEFFLAIGARA